MKDPVPQEPDPVVDAVVGPELWSSGWMHVTPRNGVWDDYYARTEDPANCSFDFRVMRYRAAWRSTGAATPKSPMRTNAHLV